MSPQDLLNKLHDARFKPFRVRLTNNITYDVTDPGVVIVGPTSAVLPVLTTEDDLGYTLVTQWRTVALNHMVEFVDLEEPKASKRKGK